jgi:hypothetical protein
MSHYWARTGNTQPIEISFHECRARADARREGYHRPDFGFRLDAFPQDVLAKDMSAPGEVRERPLPAAYGGKLEMLRSMRALTSCPICHLRHEGGMLRRDLGRRAG